MLILPREIVNDVAQLVGTGAYAALPTRFPQRAEDLLIERSRRVTQLLKVFPFQAGLGISQPPKLNAVCDRYAEKRLSRRAEPRRAGEIHFPLFQQAQDLEGLRYDLNGLARKFQTTKSIFSFPG